MKGWHTPKGYMGWIWYKQTYMEFASEADYKDYLNCSGDCNGDCENCTKCS